MADPYVSPVNVLTDLDGRTIVVGVDYEAVTIHVGSFEPGGGIRFGPSQFRELVAALTGAASDAAEMMRQKADEEAADEGVCHCGAPTGGSDHCPRCYCEESEEPGCGGA